MISLGSSPTTTIEYKMNVVNYTPSGAIDIDGNQDFNDTAEAEGWPGSGTETNPYVITGLNITSGSMELLKIRHTTVYYEITDCYFEWQHPGGIIGSPNPIGIYLINSTNGYIENNTIEDQEIHFGIILSDTNDTIITNNKINGVYLRGIDLETNSCNNLIFSNLVEQIGASGAQGILISYASNNNEIYNNTIEAADYGILISENSNQTVLKRNNITDCTLDGILVETSCFRTKILENSLSDITDNGIHLSDHSNETVVKYNTIKDCDSYGIRIESDVNDTTVSFNNFINSNGTLGAQALNDGLNSNFEFNYWSDHTSPDTEPDGFVDIPYTLNGSASNNSDEYPLTDKFVHILTRPIIYFPSGGETLKGTVKIFWMPSGDYFSHSITYLIEYSSDGGSSWNEIISSITGMTHNWDTTSVTDGNNFLIRVTSSCDGGLRSISVSGSVFTVNNVEDTSDGTSTSSNGKSSPGWTLIPFLLSISIIIHRKKTKRR